LLGSAVQWLGTTLTTWPKEKNWFQLYFSKGEWPPTKECGAPADFIGCPVEVPEHFGVMGAIGAAILAKERLERTGAITKFCGDEPIEQLLPEQ